MLKKGQKSTRELRINSPAWELVPPEFTGVHRNSDPKSTRELTPPEFTGVHRNSPESDITFSENPGGMAHFVHFFRFFDFLAEIGHFVHFFTNFREKRVKLHVSGGLHAFCAGLQTPLGSSQGPRTQRAKFAGRLLLWAINGVVM